MRCAQATNVAMCRKKYDEYRRRQFQQAEVASGKDEVRSAAFMLCLVTDHTNMLPLGDPGAYH
eukprot:964309-Pelagomonas_calceolata.AAC.1